MRELEFLPDWYPRVRRRKRMVVLHGWMTLVVALGLGLWLALAHRNVSRAEAALRSFDSLMVQSETEKRQLNEQLDVKKELLIKEQIVAELGFPVEMSRLLRTLDGVMPKEMSLVEASFDTEERPAAAATNAAAARATPENMEGPRFDRKLIVNLRGVAPTDVDLANFIAGLTSLPFLQDVALVKANDKTDNGHLMREFVVKFQMDLNQPVSR
jgi:hypothetical protein